MKLVHFTVRTILLCKRGYGEFLPEFPSNCCEKSQKFKEDTSSTSKYNAKAARFDSLGFHISLVLLLAMGDNTQTIIQLEEGWTKQIKIVALDPLEVMFILVHLFYKIRFFIKFR